MARHRRGKRQGHTRLLRAGNHQREDHARRGRARAVALSIEDRRTELWQQRSAALGEDRIRYVFGKRLRDYGGELGRFRMITDVYGGLSYTDELSTFIEKVLRLLEVNGSFYSLLQSVRLEDGKDNPRTWYLTEIVDAAERDVEGLLVAEEHRVRAGDLRIESPMGSADRVDSHPQGVRSGLRAAARAPAIRGRHASGETLSIAALIARGVRPRSIRRRLSGSGDSGACFAARRAVAK